MLNCERRGDVLTIQGGRRPSERVVTSTPQLLTCHPELNLLNETGESMELLLLPLDEFIPQHLVRNKFVRQIKGLNTWRVDSDSKNSVFETMRS